ncbi:hypothetical protein [Bradyrhizobium elkanii]|uniref:hypothetical protein n=1 Tax=Bradyrhizobium elkanii TaxID=29448 RepID=UPI003D215DEF
MKLSDIKAGDTIYTDAGFTCTPAGKHVVKSDNGDLYIECDHGKHFLSGQEDEQGSDLVGIS